ncbi:MAG: DUF2442 domain-containing protein [Acidaminococcaceae bacterium]|nr:DUF2442 domain-containing protein [Acidaminococcaceae bacterium]
MSKQEKRKKVEQPDFFHRLKRGAKCTITGERNGEDKSSSASPDKPGPAVSEVFPLRDYWLLVFFSNGEVRLYDCAWFLRITSMEKMQKKDFFKGAKVGHDLVKWNKNIALDAGELYGNSVPLTDDAGKILKLL